MAEFIVRITTPARRKPATRAEDIQERARIQQTLLQIAGAVSNCAKYEGTATGAGANAKCGYEAND